jgi:hypothetical protein
MKCTPFSKIRAGDAFKIWSKLWVCRSSTPFKRKEELEDSNAMTLPLYVLLKLAAMVTMGETAALLI